MAAGAERPEAALAPVVEQRLGEDAARGVAGAQEQYVVEFGVGHRGTRNLLGWAGQQRGQAQHLFPRVAGAANVTGAQHAAAAAAAPVAGANWARSTPTRQPRNSAQRQPRSRPVRSTPSPLRRPGQRRRRNTRSRPASGNPPTRFPAGRAPSACRTSRSSSFASGSSVSVVASAAANCARTAASSSAPSTCRPRWLRPTRWCPSRAAAGGRWRS